MTATFTMFTFAMAGLIMSAGGNATGGGFRLPPFASKTLKNGMRIYTMEYHELPLVDFEVIVGAGAAHDPRGKEGLADLVADLLRKGTAAKTAREIADAVDFVGGTLAASADQDGTRLVAEFLTKDLDLGIDLVADTLTSPAFSGDEVDRQKAETISELQAAREDPGLVASRRFVEILYRDHAYGHPAPGWESTVASITRDEVLRFYRERYTPDNTILIAVGDFNSQAMAAKLEARFSAWSGRAIAKDGAGEPKAPAARGILLIDKRDATQSQIRIGGLGIRRVDEDYPALHVANTILGGGFTSRLVEEVRVNRGLSYGISSRFYPLLQRGPFMISTFTKNATTLETIKVVLEVADRLRKEGPTAEEVDKARRYVKGSFAIGHQSPGSMAEALGDIAFYGLPRDYYDTWLDKVAAVTVEDVRRVQAKFPAQGRMIVVLGDAEAIRKDLETLGPVTLLPLSEH